MLPLRRSRKALIFWRSTWVDDSWVLALPLRRRHRHGRVYNCASEQMDSLGLSVTVLAINTTGTTSSRLTWRSFSGAHQLFTYSPVSLSTSQSANRITRQLKVVRRICLPHIYSGIHIARMTKLKLAMVANARAYPSFSTHGFV